MEGIGRYIKEIYSEQRQELMTREEEQRVAEIKDSPDATKEERARARDRLIEANLRFVVSMAKKIYQSQAKGRGCSINDLIAVGNQALVDASERFDHREGTKFISYAVWYIERYMKNEMMRYTGVVRIPRSRTKREWKIEAAKREVRQEKYREPTLEELQNRTGLKRSDINKVRRENNGEESLFTTKGKEDDEELTLLSLLGRDDFREELKEAGAAESNARLIAKLLESLTERERQAVLMYYGIQHEWEITLEEIGSRYGVSRAAVGVWLNKARKKMRKKAVELGIRRGDANF